MAEEVFETSGTNAPLPKIPEDVLQDLCSRFLINIPNNEKHDMVRICFQIELAHWYYIDFCRQDDPELPPCGMKTFISIIFTEFSFLNKTKEPIHTIYENWKKYKVRVPVFGAILLDESLAMCLLVQGYHNKTSWGFPKGKVNKDEGDLQCATREVWEEVGFDISPFANSDQFLENTIHDHQVRLYIVPGVDQNFVFRPNTRGEIKEIRWFPVEHLPTHKKDTAPKEAFGLMANNFFMIHPFIKPLRKWISDKKNMTSLRIKPLLKMQAMRGPCEDKESDEIDELLKKQKKEKEAEEFKRMHLLMNPLRSNEDDEQLLKSMLGLNTNHQNVSARRNSDQPEAIRKLLSGTVSPVVSTDITHNKLASSEMPYVAKKKESLEFGNSPHGFKIGGSMSVDSPIKGRSGSMTKSDKSANGRFVKDEKRNLSNSPAKKLHYRNSADENVNIPHQFRPFSPPRNSPNLECSDAAYKPHHYRAFSPTEKRNSLISYGTERTEYGDYVRNRSTDYHSEISEFEFYAPAFLNFKLDYQKILSVLT